VCNSIEGVCDAVATDCCQEERRHYERKQKRKMKNEKMIRQKRWQRPS